MLGWLVWCGVVWSWELGAGEGKCSWSHDSPNRGEGLELP